MPPTNLLIILKQANKQKVLCNFCLKYYFTNCYKSSVFLEWGERAGSIKIWWLGCRAVCSLKLVPCLEDMRFSRRENIRFPRKTSKCLYVPFSLSSLNTFWFKISHFFLLALPLMTVLVHFLVWGTAPETYTKKIMAEKRVCVDGRNH